MVLLDGLSFGEQCSVITLSPMILVLFHQKCNLKQIFPYTNLLMEISIIQAYHLLAIA